MKKQTQANLADTSTEVSSAHAYAYTQIYVIDQYWGNIRVFTRQLGSFCTLLNWEGSSKSKVWRRSNNSCQNRK